MFGNGRHRIFVYALVSFSLLLFAANVAWGQRAVLPVVGIGGGQVLRVGIAALPFDDDGGNVLNCDATLSFFDTRTGALVGEVRRFDLRPGEADFVDLDSETLDLDRKKRTDIQPVLDPSPDTGPCEFSYSVLNSVFGKLSAYGDSETLDLVPTGTPIPPICSSFVSFATLFETLLPGLGFGQTMLYTVVRKTGPVFDLNNDPLPCDITVNIQEGPPLFPLVVASLVTGPLAPGQIASVSVNSTSLGLEKGETAFLGRQVVSSIEQIPFTPDLTCPVDTRRGCFTSVQIIDNKFGTTMTLTIQVFQ